MHSLRTFWHMLLMMPSRDGAWHGDRGRRLGGQKTMPERVWMYGRRLTAQQKNERQDNGDMKRLVRHHPSDLLSSLTCEWIGGG